MAYKEAMMKKFGEAMRRRREELMKDSAGEWTGSGLAAKINVWLIEHDQPTTVSQQSVSNWEAGKNTPGVVIRTAIKEILGLDANCDRCGSFYYED